MSVEIPSHNSPDAVFESLWLKCITLIARGTTRDVFAIPEHTDKVLKISNRQSNLSNWSEIILHNHKKDSGDLAEIFSWSSSGKFIVMQKLSQVTPEEMLGYSYPIYLTDRKPENYGKDASGKIKALDYATIVFPASTSSMFMQRDLTVQK